MDREEEPDHDEQHGGLEELRSRFMRAEAELSDELERLVAENRERFRYRVQAGRVRFEAGMQMLHRSYRKGLIAYVRNAPLSYLITAPLIYSLVIPLVLLDLFVTVIQQVCFRVYGIGLVTRGDYIVIDRQALGYLNAIEKVNCVYCGYANGLIAYCREVAARTEQYWCPIKHARRAKGLHDRASGFFSYGDAEAYRNDLPKIRAKLVD